MDSRILKLLDMDAKILIYQKKISMFFVGPYSFGCIVTLDEPQWSGTVYTDFKLARSLIEASSPPPPPV